MSEQQEGRRLDPEAAAAHARLGRMVARHLAERWRRTGSLKAPSERGPGREPVPLVEKRAS